MMKNFVKPMDKKAEGFKHLRKLLPQISEPKIKEGIFAVPGINNAICNSAFEGKLNQKEL